MKKLNLEWLRAAAIRALKTLAQTALSMFTVGAAISEVNWLNILSVAVVAGAYSMLTSVAGLPEAGADGTLQIDTSNPDKDTYRLALNDELDTLGKKRKVRFTVDTKADSLLK